MRQKKIKIATLVELEVMSGLVTIFTFMLALLMANSNFTSYFYQDVISLPVTVRFGTLSFDTTIRHIINDGLITLFFLFIGMELKYQLVYGEYRDKKALVVPTFAAVGGIVMPALAYLFFNSGQDSARGWAIPIATDTAFMLAIVSLFGSSVSSKLKAFILSFSLIDDALALAILAVFYTVNIDLVAIYLSIAVVLILIVLNLKNVKNNSVYLILGGFLWFFMLESGCNAALSGAILALTLPVMEGDKVSPAFHRLEKIMRPLVCFVVLPFFIFINSGVDLDLISFEVLASPISLGIISGLFIGKPIGIFCFSWIAVKLKFGCLPKHLKWSSLFAISALGGIGFTLSLFIGDITFPITETNYVMRVGVIVGSLLSAMLGCLGLFISERKFETTSFTESNNT